MTKDYTSLLLLLAYPTLKAFWITLSIGLAFLALCSIKTLFKIRMPTVQVNHVLYIGGSVTNK